MQKVAALMKFALEKEDIDEFASLLNQHWEISKKLDAGSTNTCIDQIFSVCEDMIDGKFISGAGGRVAISGCRGISMTGATSAAGAGMGFAAGRAGCCTG